MSIDPTHREITIREAPKESPKTKETVNKQELSTLAAEGKPKKATQTRTGEPTLALVKEDSKSTSKSIRKAIVSFFDRSLPDVDEKGKVDKKEKLKHEKEVRSFFKEYKPESNVEDGRKFNDPEFIKKTLDTLLTHIDDAAKLKKEDRQPYTDKVLAIIKSDEFSQNLSLDVAKNVTEFLMDYRNKQLG